MTRPSRRQSAFTLIELLVVVAIIGVLVALLLPAVQAAREAARRIACTNNQRQLGLAAIHYEGTHDQFPSWKTEIAGHEASWAVPLLPYLEQNSLWREFREGRPTRVYLKVFVCPSNPAESGDADRSPSAYAANIEVMREERGLSVGQISQRDGASQTLLFSENLKKHRWDDLDPETIGFRAEGAMADHLDSHHGGVVIVVFCDWHVRPIPTGLDDDIYHRLCDPMDDQLPIGDDWL